MTQVQRSSSRQALQPVPVYVSRLTKLPLLDIGGAPVGRIADVVILPPTLMGAPRVIGFVAAVERRRIFVNAAKIESLDTGGARLRAAAIDLRHFSRRGGELLIREDLLDRRIGDEIVNDVGLVDSEARGVGWEVATVSLRSPRPIRRRGRSHTVQWSSVVTLFDAGPMAREMAGLRELHPSDLADRLRALPLAQRMALTAAMDDLTSWSYSASAGTSETAAAWRASMLRVSAVTSSAVASRVPMLCARVA